MGVTVNSKRARNLGPLRQPQRSAFTLVELLTVVVIIGILIALITAAAIAARSAAKRATIRIEINELDAAVEQYKSERGEYPPDFAGIAAWSRSATHPDVRKAAVRAVARHLRKAFPRYWGLDPSDDTTWAHFVDDVKNGYGYDPETFDPATALVFWLGGLPEQAGDVPAGFHSDPARPFRPGAPRTARLFDFNKDRLVMSIQDGPNGTVRYLRYNPPYLETPYVYFRARKEQLPPSGYGSGRYDYGVVYRMSLFAPAYYAHSFAPPSDSPANVCVPYLDKVPDPLPDPLPNPGARDTTRLWRNQERFQIITAGLDNLFDQPLTATPPFRCSRSGLDYVGGTLVPWSMGDMDNLTNFSQGTLEDELQ